MPFYRKIAVAVVDLVVLGQLTLSIYLASQDPENFTPLVFKYFFSMLLPTLAAAFVIIRKCFPKETHPA